MDDLYLSDESNFYGSDDTKLELESKVARLDPFSVASMNGGWQLTKIANEGAKRLHGQSKAGNSFEPWNPYNHLLFARHNDETVAEFLARVPPRTTLETSENSWIWVSNPFHRQELGQNSLYTEGPTDQYNRNQLETRGSKLLDNLTADIKNIEADKTGKSTTRLSRMISDVVKYTEGRLRKCAKELSITSGKWLLFVDPADIDDVWGIIAHATAEGRLGHVAKVSPRSSNSEDRAARVICVYTRDFSDILDVKRVLDGLKGMGLINTRKGGIFYKSDAYTYLDLKSGNPYNIKASMYSSKELLAMKPTDLLCKYPEDW